MSLDYFGSTHCKIHVLGFHLKSFPEIPILCLCVGWLNPKVRFNTILNKNGWNPKFRLLHNPWSPAIIDLHFSDFHRHRLWKSLGGSTHRNSISHPSPRENASESSGPSIHSQSFEGVRLENLTKVFRLSKGVTRTAVNDLTIEFRLGEVTALLGHNGAGKSTTM